VKKNQRRKQKMKQEINFWIKIVFIVSSIMLITVGFALGYLYGNRYYDENPLIQGIKTINAKTVADFACSCVSLNNKKITFSFSKNGVREAYFWPETD